MTESFSNASIDSSASASESFSSPLNVRRRSTVSRLCFFDVIEITFAIVHHSYCPLYNHIILNINIIQTYGSLFTGQKLVYGTNKKHRNDSLSCFGTKPSDIATFSYFLHVSASLGMFRHETVEFLVEQKMPDFVLLILIGHGATQSSRQLFKINRTTVIKAGQLALDVDKQLVIVESCRTEIRKVETVDLKDRIPKFREGGIVRAPISRTESKEIYLTQLDYCPDGMVICHACQTNEVAANFHFSQALLTRSFEWHLLTLYLK